MLIINVLIIATTAASIGSLFVVFVHWYQLARELSVGKERQIHEELKSSR